MTDQRRRLWVNIETALGIWSILCGLNSKFHTPDFEDNLLNFDFVVLTETKCNDIDTEVLSDKLDKLGYFTLYKNRQKNYVYLGGILIFARAYSKMKRNCVRQKTQHVYGF